MPGNSDAYQVFMRCGDQWIYGHYGQRVSMLNTAIESTIRLVGARDPLDCFDRVKAIASRMAEADARALKEAQEK